jgi:hypothetical protein
MVERMENPLSKDPLEPGMGEERRVPNRAVTGLTAALIEERDWPDKQEHPRLQWHETKMLQPSHTVALAPVALHRPVSIAFAGHAA